MSSLDFRANQIRLNKLITSGSTGTNASFLLYPFSVATDISGGIDNSKFVTSSIPPNTFFYISGSATGDYFGGTTPVSGTHFGGAVVVSGNFSARNGLALENGSETGAYIRVQWFDGTWRDFLQNAGAGFDMGSIRNTWRFQATRSFPEQDDVNAYPSYQFGGVEPSGVGTTFYSYVEIRSGISGTAQFPNHNGELILGSDYGKRFNTDVNDNYGQAIPFVIHGRDVLTGSLGTNTDTMGIPLHIRAGTGTGMGTGSYVAIQAGRRATSTASSSQVIKDIGIFWHDGRFQIPGDLSSSIPTPSASYSGSLYYATDTGQLFYHNASTWVLLTGSTTINNITNSYITNSYVSNSYVSNSYYSLTGSISASVSTSNATPTLLTGVFFEDNTLYDVNVTLLGKNNDLFNFARWKRNFVLYRTSGSNVTINGIPQAIVTDQTSGSLDWNYLVSGSSLQFWVTGSAATNIVWSITGDSIGL